MQLTRDIAAGSAASGIWTTIEWRECVACVALGLALSLAAANFAIAQTYPTQAVRLIVPYPPAGGADLVARVYAEGLSKRLGQQVIVENRPGANGNIGAAAVVAAKPDGHTLLLTANLPLTANPSLYSSMSFSPQKDLAPIAIVSSAPLILVVHPGLPAQSVKQLAEYGQKNPGVLNFASAGVGSSGHLAGELFKSIAGIKMLHVPFKGTAPATTAILAGQVTVMFNNLPPSLPLIKSGKLRALAVTDHERSPAAPDFQTMGEAGYPELDVTIWNPVLAPAGTSRTIIEKLNAELTTLSKVPEIRERLAAQGVVASSSTPDQLRTRIREETIKWEKVIHDAGIPKE